MPFASARWPRHMPTLSIHSQILAGTIKVTQRSSTEHRFWASVNKNGPVHPVIGSKCWLWTRCVISGGYGGIRLKMVLTPAHRVSWTLHYGDPGKDMVLHQCDVKLCVNPGHLYLGGHSENTIDAYTRGQSIPIRGEDAWLAKLTEDIVRHCRMVHKKGHKLYSTAALAKRFGVNTETMRAAIIGKSWNHVSATD